MNQSVSRQMPYLSRLVDKSWNPRCRSEYSFWFAETR